MTLGRVCIAVNKGVSAVQLVTSYVYAIQDICNTVCAGLVPQVTETRRWAVAPRLGDRARSTVCHRLGDRNMKHSGAPGL